MVEITSEQKSALIYRIAQFIASNDKVRSQARAYNDLIDLIIAITKGQYIRLSSRQLVVREFQKFPEMWSSLRPFIRNSESHCLTENIEKSNSGSMDSAPCYHYAEDHVNGVCIGKHYDWGRDDKGDWERVYRPCACKKYTSKAKW